MEQAEYRQLKPGLYIIFWNSGGSSWASIGVLPNGDKWIAPTNWVYPSERQSVCKDIRLAINITPKPNNIKVFFYKLFNFLKASARR